MATDMIMRLGSIVFAVLFLFLVFVFVTVIISIFKKEKYKDYKPKVSVVIPCYNEEENIKDCLDAVYGLDYPEEKIEIIVVDDGSRDSTLKIISNYKKEHKNLIILKAKHKGKSASLNLGVKKAKYELILTVDADTIIYKNSLKMLVKPFSNKEVGATNGSCIAKNTNSLLGAFQGIEYHYNNLMRRSFSAVFKNVIWFFGAFACYRKEVLKNIRYFKKDTLTEDMDTAMEIYSHGYRTVNVYNALCLTLVPSGLKALFNQRARWWAGAWQTLGKNKTLFSFKSNPSILFLFVNQYWWSFFSVVSLPLIVYQIHYWLPVSSSSILEFFMYFFRWFSILGPVYVIYKIPVWGISTYNIFGVLSGIMSIFLITRAIYMFGDRMNLKNVFAIFFYFPYTIILNTIILTSLIRLIFLKRRYFIYK